MSTTIAAAAETELPVRYLFAASALQGILAGRKGESALEIAPNIVAACAVAMGDATLRKLQAGRSAMDAEAWEIVRELATLQFGEDLDRFKLGHLVARARGVLEVKEGGGS